MTKATLLARARPQDINAAVGELCIHFAAPVFASMHRRFIAPKENFNVGALARSGRRNQQVSACTRTKYRRLR